MHLLALYFEGNAWWAEWLAGCVVVVEGPLTWADAMWLELLL